MKKLLLVAVLMATSITFAQKATEGKIKNLKGISEYNLVFDYENVKVHKFDTEEEFLKDKMDKREKKHPGEGRGEKFKKSWFADRENLYEPKFIESFNKRFDNQSVKADKGLESAKHTMLVKTTWIYPGYNIGIQKSPSKVTATIKVYETANPDNVLYSGVFKNQPGATFGGGDFNSGIRIAESYAKLAKSVAKYIIKKAK
ncbi:hypothetical protein [Aquimarina sp. 2201CG14-23]|uniref:hypothetical protein n=1 Tax=Aquimarina mycalae TaxID=3040073 RepID=UPI002477E644|nr:hypothetical protein [Aquimarina sp. 2201CG14-23]MDH7446758.1 hypothetical protein [Aquimarina sp. 2201CG14-23]